jgi:hypothetical protein
MTSIPNLASLRPFDLAQDMLGERNIRRCTRAAQISCLSNAKHAEVAKECEAEETRNSKEAPRIETNPNDQKHKIQNNLVSDFELRISDFDR